MGDELTQGLVSITEESGEVSDMLTGARNSLVRSSKEILRTHKVPFPGFKKLKDKEKEKEKDGGQAAAIKAQQTKNGGLLNMDGVKESMIIAATKQLTRKDKKASMQAASVDVADTTMFVDKTSPLLQGKRKSSSVEIGSIAASFDTVQLQTFSNGNSIVEENKIEMMNENVGPIDLNTDFIVSQQRSSVVIDQNGKTSTVVNNNTQMSQV